MLDYEEPTPEERLNTLAAIEQVGVSPSNALNHLTEDVKLFHMLFGHPAPRTPQMQTPELVERRAKWIRSEVKELEDATTIYEQADAYLDVIYFACGGLVELGLKFTHRLWRLVQAANLNKIWPDGTVRKSEVGKVIKPDGWVAPDAAIASAIDEELRGAVADDQQTPAISQIGDEVVERLSILSGGHVRIMLFAVNEEGFVASTSNMVLDDQRDFLRYIHQSLASGDVTLVQDTEGMTKQ